MNDTLFLNVGDGVLTHGGKGTMGGFDLAEDKRDDGLAFSRRVLSSAARVKVGAKDGSSFIRELVEVLINLLINLSNEEVRSA